jgi:hypothetical protein
MEDTVERRAMVAAVAATAAAGRPVRVIHLAEVVAMPAAADTQEAEATGRSNAAAWFVLSKTSCRKRSEDSRGEKGRANRHAPSYFSKSFGSRKD